MRYKMVKNDGRDIRLEKHTELKGFFHNIGSSKVGEIKLYDDTKEGWFEEYLAEEDEPRYMELGCINGFGLIYQGESPSISIGDKIHIISAEERIKFLYEALSSEAKYNCLGIIYKDQATYRYKKTLFEITRGLNLEDLSIVTFNINDL